MTPNRETHTRQNASRKVWSVPGRSAVQVILSLIPSLLHTSNSREAAREDNEQID